jgi:hypothetical protein
MKKQVKKLVLAKETLQRLEATTLTKVVAGFSIENHFCQPGQSDGTLCTVCDC